MQRRSRGFTLLEVLVVVGIIGVITAIAIMNYRNALTRAKQKTTMADMTSIAVAWEARAVDVKRYNAAGAFTVPAATVRTEELVSILSPTYIRTLPERDAWGTPYAFNTDQRVGDAVAADEYCIRSAGRDARFSSSYTPGAKEDPDEDIVYSSGTFIVWPALPK